jgi:pimeloyl-ACP methyl ester carboxylesterase
VIESERADWIDIDGRRYAWRSIGSGPELILLNGYSATAQDWDPTLLGALEATFDVICPDHRGMGESDLGDPNAVTIDSMAEDVERLLDAVGVERAPVVGWSMGGFVAQRLARRAPHRVTALGLMSSDPGGASAVRAAPEAWAQLTDHSGTPREQASRIIPLLFPPVLVPAIEEAFGEMMATARAALSPEALEAQRRAMEAWHAEEQPAPAAGAVPRVLVMGGSEDIVIPPQNEAALAAAWPGAEVESFIGGGHAFFALEPHRVAERITEFLVR